MFSQDCKMEEHAIRVGLKVKHSQNDFKASKNKIALLNKILKGDPTILKSMSVAELESLQGFLWFFAVFYHFSDFDRNSKKYSKSAGKKVVINNFKQYPFIATLAFISGVFCVLGGTTEATSCL
jgi:hypothetical protein